MKTNVLKVSLCAVALLATTLAASQPLAAAEKETVSYRLTKWKTLHFEEAKVAKEHHDTMKLLGCEVKQASHGGHIDVSYYCPQWKEAAMETHEKAHKWEKWLRSMGFEARHTH
jgi:hypothetical protein